MNKFFLLFLVYISTFYGFSQENKITLSGIVKSKTDNNVLPFVQLVIKKESDSSFVGGTISDEEGRFSISSVAPGDYLLVVSFLDYDTLWKKLYVGTASPYIDLSTLLLEEVKNTQIEEIVINAPKPEDVGTKMDKKVILVDDNIAQSGGSVLQVMQNIPGITVQDGKVQLRGSDKVTILIDGKQTALTGFGDQYGLENIPASSIERIEVINNPSAKYDANGNAGIINIIMKKTKQDGFSGKVGLSGGLGALWIKHENLPTIRPQYQTTPKINPSIFLSYRKNKTTVFLQSDYLFTQTLNKNEFVTRTYDDGTVINQQTKRNRDTHFTTTKIGLDWNYNERNLLTVSGLFGTEKILDHGDEPFFDGQNRTRLWQFLEDELKITAMGIVNYQHKFKQPGSVLNAGFNYTFHRENEKYFFTNVMPTYTGYDSFKLLSDEQVADFNVDYSKPLKYGRLETGVKFRARGIPTNMQFFPGLNSPLDTNAGGWAKYKEIIPAIYGNYIIDREKIEAEVGLRIEYVNLKYQVNPDHNTYKSSGYDYFQPFPTLRFAYKVNSNNKLSVFFNRRVDRPNEVDIRIFPKYDDAEIIKVGNPGLRPQFTNSAELGYKTNWNKGYFYTALYGRNTTGTITRIASTVPGSTLIYNVFQNAGKSYNSGIEFIFSQKIKSWYTLNVNGSAYYNQINAFTVVNKYPTETTVSVDQQSIYSGNLKMNNVFHFKKSIDMQVTAIYLAPDLIPQGKMAARFTLDLGVKKKIQNGKGELFINATDLLNTMVISKTIQGNGFRYVSKDYYETQVVRIGYSYKF